MEVLTWIDVEDVVQKAMRTDERAMQGERFERSMLVDFDEGWDEVAWFVYDDLVGVGLVGI
jgi:hypothetical protein